MTLDEEAKKITELLKGKDVLLVRRNRKNELLIQFTDGSRLFVDSIQDKLDISITAGHKEK